MGCVWIGSSWYEVGWSEVGNGPYRIQFEGGLIRVGLRFGPVVHVTFGSCWGQLILIRFEFGTLDWLISRPYMADLSHWGGSI